VHLARLARKQRPCRKPNGTTFLLVFDTHGVNPSLLLNLPFNTLNDLSPIMLIGKSPMVITAHPATAYRRFDDVLAAAKKNPSFRHLLAQSVRAASHISP